MYKNEILVIAIWLIVWLIPAYVWGEKALIISSGFWLVVLGFICMWAGIADLWTK